MNKYFVIMLCLFLSQLSFASEPNDKASQCEQYGAYQNADGEWITCEYEEEPEYSESEREEEQTDYEEDQTGYQEESNY